MQWYSHPRSRHGRNVCCRPGDTSYPEGASLIEILTLASELGEDDTLAESTELNIPANAYDYELFRSFTNDLRTQTPPMLLRTVTDIRWDFIALPDCLPLPGYSRGDLCELWSSSLWVRGRSRVSNRHRAKETAMRAKRQRNKRSMRWKSLPKLPLFRPSS